MIKTITLGVLCIMAIAVNAQKEASNWYFGENAGLTFNNDGTVLELTDGKLNTAEGCTTISDAGGNLLFYTDGITVWDRRHRPMPNANLESGGLFGDPSSAQSAIVIPKPNDENLYYIFTVDTRGPNDPIDFGFNYSTIDLRLNQGFGDVVETSKNINLRSDSSEKISAVVKDCETQELWVLTLGPSNRIRNRIVYDTFYAYQITDNGVDTTPVTSTFPLLDITDPRGYLKFSPDGTKIASANVRSGLFLYDFDVNTGIVSNQLELTIKASLPDKPQSPYGLEFSQTNALLYVTAYYDSPDPVEFNDPRAQYTSLLQFDLTSQNISNTAIILDERVGFRGGIQLGIDGKIYRAMSETFFNGLPYLSVINSPNARGLDANYQHNKIQLSRNSTQGLPPFITSFFTQKIDIIGRNSNSIDLPLCNGESFLLQAPQFTNATYIWTLNGEVLSNTNNVLNIENDLDGLYSVLIDLNTGRCEDRFEGAAIVSFLPNPLASNAQISQCDEDGMQDGITVFNLEEAKNDLTQNNTQLLVNYFTNVERTDRITNPTQYTNTGNNQIIYAQVYNPDTLCSTNVELTLNVSITDVIDTSIAQCDDDGLEDGFYEFNLSTANDDITDGFSLDFTVTFYASLENALVEQNMLNETFTNTIPFLQTIYARVESNNNCFGISTINLIVDIPPKVEEEALVKYCTNFFPNTIPINAGAIEGNINDFTYDWSNGASGYRIDINEIATYSVVITNKTSGCFAKRMVRVEPSNTANFNSIEVIDVTQNNLVTVNVSGEGIYEYSLTNQDRANNFQFQDNNVFTNVRPGIYTVSVRDVENNCGIVNQDISVVGFPKYFTPNNDGQNDTWQVFGVSGMFQPNTKILIFNRYGKLIKELSPLDSGWDGLLNGRQLPADDYWFSVQLQDGRIFKNHFTLKY